MDPDPLPVSEKAVDNKFGFMFRKSISMIFVQVAQQISITEYKSMFANLFIKNDNSTYMRTHNSYY